MLKRSDETGDSFKVQCLGIFFVMHDSYFMCMKTEKHVL